MATLTPAFSANRTVREYTEKYYLPGAVNYTKRAAKKGVSGMKITGIQHEILNKWGDIKFGEVKTENIPGGYRFQLQVSLNGINETSVSLQLYADGINGAAPEITVMKPVKGTITDQCNNYEVKVITTRPAGDDTARVLPCYENIAVPLEDNHILWQS